MGKRSDTDKAIRIFLVLYASDAHIMTNSYTLRVQLAGLVAALPGVLRDTIIGCCRLS